MHDADIVRSGVRCDIPSHVYQSTFSPKTDWSDEFAHGAEIRDYWQAVANKYNVYDYAKFNHRVDKAVWDGEGWSLTVQDMAADTVVQDKVDFVLVGFSTPPLPMQWFQHQNVMNIESWTQPGRSELLACVAMHVLRKFAD